MAIDNASFARDFMRALLDAAATIARPQVAKASNTLADAMTREIESSAVGFLFIPHYWAVYVNDGRVTDSLLVWFKDPKDDPRLSGNEWAVRRNQVRRLTKLEWKAWRLKNRKAIADGRIVIVFSRRPRLPKKFFDNNGGMSAFKSSPGPIAKAMFSQHVKDSLGPLLNQKIVARVPLGPI